MIDKNGRKMSHKKSQQFSSDLLRGLTLQAFVEGGGVIFRTTGYPRLLDGQVYAVRWDRHLGGRRTAHGYGAVEESWVLYTICLFDFIGVCEFLPDSFCS